MGLSFAVSASCMSETKINLFLYVKNKNYLRKVCCGNKIIKA